MKIKKGGPKVAFFILLKFYNKSYFEAGRSPKNRSILGVCEDFEDKPDAKRALLENFNDYSTVPAEPRTFSHLCL